MGYNFFKKLTGYGGPQIKKGRKIAPFYLKGLSSAKN